MTRYAIPFALLLMAITVMACNKADCPCPCEEPTVESVVGEVTTGEPKTTKASPPVEVGKAEESKDAKAVEPKAAPEAEVAE